jgi:predicted nucleotidyltransferase component of viral defense system
MVSNIGASVLDRLKNVSKERGINMQAILRRYAQERLLYRLSVSAVSSDFCLKGGVLLSAYNDGNLLRPSEDVDFNAFFAGGNIHDVAAILQQIISVFADDDGVTFDLNSMKIDKDRDGKIPGGKVSLVCYVGTARVEVRVDVGFGNVITPGAKRIIMPTLLGNTVPQPEVLTYPLETVVSEKLHATVRYGISNTRLKDFYDLRLLARMHDFVGQTVCDAIVNTFDGHDDPVPQGEIVGFSDEFAEDKQSAWKAFLKKIESREAVDFQSVIEEVRGFAGPVMKAAGSDRNFPMDWNPSSGWAPVLKLAI